MTVYTIDSSNVASAGTLLTGDNRYFVITVDVTLTASVKIGANSVLEFRGGSFAASSPTKYVDLNSCQIIADPYPIFKDNIEISGLSIPEVKADWFKWSSDESDAESINRALIAAEGCPVVLEPKTYTLSKSIRFRPNYNLRQTLICPGTLLVKTASGTIPSSDDIAAINIDTGVVTLKINKIEGTEVISKDTAEAQYHGIGIKFTVYNEHSNIEVNTMSKLHMGFCVLPNVLGKHPNEPKKDIGGIQYCRIKFGSITADYCFYIDIFSKARLVNKDTGDVIIYLPVDPNKLKNYKFTPLNWFSENQISGELMRGKYGIYVVCPTEAWPSFGSYINPDNVDNAMNGLVFENISFENITELPIRLRSVNRSCFYNLQMFNTMPGDDPVGDDDYTPWIDMDNIKEVRMSFNSYVVPTHIKVGNNCRKSYIYGAILDKPSQYVSHFDVLGIDKIDDTSQMFVTNSVVPYNMTKVISSDTATKYYIKDLLPNLNGDTSSANQIDLPVLPSTLNVDIKEDKTLVIDLTGMNSFAPCLYTIYANIARGTLRFQTTDYLEIAGGVYNPDGEGVTSFKEFNESGVYSLQWLNDWKIQIKKVADLS